MPTINYRDHQVHYEQYGQGARLLICLHGIAGRGELFEEVTRPMWKDYTILALDLPFHGPTQWQGEIYNDRELADVIERLLEKYLYKRFSIMAHSMGGRVMLGILPHLVEKIDELYLFAPGGFQYVFTGSRVWWPLGLREVVRRRFEQPEGFLKILHFGDRFNMIDRHLYLMLVNQVNTPERRARLLRSWSSLYYFPMRITRQHLTALKKHQIPIYFFYGKDDQITPVRHAQKFMQRYPYAQLQVTEGNHFFVKDTLIEPFAEWYQQHQQGKAQNSQ